MCYNSENSKTGPLLYGVAKHRVLQNLRPLHLSNRSFDPNLSFPTRSIYQIPRLRYRTLPETSPVQRRLTRPRVNLLVALSKDSTSPSAAMRIMITCRYGEIFMLFPSLLPCWKLPAAQAYSAPRQRRIHRSKRRPRPLRNPTHPREEKREQSHETCQHLERYRLEGGRCV
jgi:hypothetical protein